MTDKPNILFIMTDQQHAQMMSCAGNEYLHTPAMDSLAANGIRFENGYCNNPVCGPSRVGMTTGMMPNRFGASDNGPGLRDAAIPSDVIAGSMGPLMKRAGYDTFYGGKIHMPDGLHPENTDYDVYFEDQREALPGACLDFIRKDRDKPFFAVASFINPHDICFVHRAKNGINTQDVLPLFEKACALPDDELPPLPENYVIQQGEPTTAFRSNLVPDAITPAMLMRDTYDEHIWRVCRWIYCRLTEQVDALIGQILDGLRAAGLEENTVIIFTSDHGNMDASHQLSSKGLMYEESVGVPLIVSQKGCTPGGRVDSEHLASAGLDILPTLYDYVGEAPPEHLLGHSLRPLAEGRAADGWRDYVPAENHWSRMIRSSRYKYCAFLNNGVEESLVDMVNDPGELRNLAGDPEYADVLADHRRMHAAWAEASADAEAAKYLP